MILSARHGTSRAATVSHELTVLDELCLREKNIDDDDDKRTVNGRENALDDEKDSSRGSLPTSLFLDDEGPRQLLKLDVQYWTP